MHLQKSEGKQQQQQDKAGTQNTLLKAGCMDALLPLVGASSVVLRSQVYFKLAMHGVASRL